MTKWYNTTILIPILTKKFTYKTVILKTRFGASQYNKPTPRKLRQLGDALLSVSTFITAAAITEEMKWLAYTALFVGAAGKFFTNFFSEYSVEN